MEALHFVLPELCIFNVTLLIFYGVDLSYVQHQKGRYEERFARLEEKKGSPDGMEKLNKWRMAMHHTTNIPDFDSISYSILKLNLSFEIQLKLEYVVGQNHDEDHTLEFHIDLPAMEKLIL
ncbi:hypothetical protein VNO77_04140 [Canavalia gladiata]|uniref:TIR domain-containing protein n=1 Tax=Canavalia gladiata TaxID=3824 RepID=A0AAN9R7H9_CANGL